MRDKSQPALYALKILYVLERGLSPAERLMGGYDPSGLSNDWTPSLILELHSPGSSGRNPYRLLLPCHDITDFAYSRLIWLNGA